MVYNKRKRSKSTRRSGYKKRTWKKRRFNRTVKSRRNVATSQLINLRYVDTISLNPGGSGAGVNHNFNANSINDPDLTGTGHQVMGHDRLSLMYDHYVVVGAKIIVKFMTIDANVSNNQFVTLSLNDSVPSVGTVATFIENQRGAYGVLGSAGGGHDVVTLSKTYSPKKFFGLKDIKDATQLKSLFSGDPSETAIFTLSAQALTNNDPAGMQCLVTILYSVLCTEPKTQTQD